MLLREVIYEVIESYQGGTPTDDNRLRPRRVYAALRMARKEVLRVAKEKKQATTSYNLTTVSCIPTEETTFHECGCLPVQGCTIRKVLCDFRGADIMDVTYQDGSVRFSEVDWSRLAYISGEKYTSKAKRFFVKNGIVFILNGNEKNLTVRGSFDDPVLAQLCSECSTTDCTSPLDLDFSVDQEYMPLIIIRAKELLNQNKEDAKNDELETIQ